MRFCTWNVRNIYRSGSLTTIARKLAKNKLGVFLCVCVQEVFAGRKGEL